MNYKNIILAAVSILILGTVAYLDIAKKQTLPIVAIANYGPHSSLDAAIAGMKAELEKEGFIEGKTIQYDIADVGFQLALIPQMVIKLHESHPKVMVLMGTPIAQFAKGAIKDTPLVYSVVTDPLGSGLIKSVKKGDKNIVGSSDRQDTYYMLEFVKKLIPNAKRVGLLYSTAESNDAALLEILKEAANANGMQVVAVPVDQARDVPVRVQEFMGKVDFIYVGSSGVVQPALPAIAAEARRMGVPVINLDEEAVKEGMVLASFGVNYLAVGANTGKLVAAVLNGTPIEELLPVAPLSKDHHGFVNAKQAKEFGISLKVDLGGVTIVGE